MLADLALITPLLVVAVTGLIALLVSVFTPPHTFKGWLAYLTSFGYLVALGSVFWLWGEAPVGFETRQLGHALVLDHFGLALSGVILLGALLVTLWTVDYLPAQKTDHGEFYALVAFSTVGMMVLVMAADLLTFFVGLELMSIAVYVLAGFKRQSRFSTEAGMKYFVLGAFASAVLLLGIGFTYGATGSATMGGIGAAIAQGLPPGAMALAGIGLVLILVAFFFKVAAAPFHMWTPDVYEGAPTAATAFMAVAVKAAAFGGFARLLLTAFGDETFRAGDIPWETIIAIVAVISMFAGNLMALAQKNLKRMLAYSAVAHTGYILLALLTVPSSLDGAGTWLGGGIVFYLLAYTCANAAAFGVAAAVSDNDVEDVSEVAYAGLARRSPGLALALAIAMLSLLGIPLTAGFMGKVKIFEEVLTVGDAQWLWIVVVAVVNSIISAWYYLRVILVAYMRDETEARPIQLIKSRSLGFGVAVATILTIFFGVLPSPALDASNRAGESLAETTLFTGATIGDAAPIDPTQPAAVIAQPTPPATR